MKLIAHIFLFIFIAFLSTPIIVTMIEKSSDNSMFFNMSEDEQVQKEVKNIAYFVPFQATFILKRTIKSSLIHSENLSKHNNITKSIFSPPPNYS
jgi:hypothetical protein